jgi:acyl dehydratase
VQVARALRDPLVTRKVTFTAEQITAYAEASGDHNPIHLDDDFARSVGLPGRIAHGMLQMGIAGTVAAEAAGGGSRLRKLQCRFAGFTAEPAAAGELDLRAVNQRGESVLSRAAAEYG